MKIFCSPTFTKRWTAGLVAFGVLMGFTPLGMGAGETQGDIVFFPGTLAPLMPSSTNPSGDAVKSQKYGWNLPGAGYRAGTGWWALSCEWADEAAPAACRLSPTNLSISKGAHPVYDGNPIPSQLLHWSPLPGPLTFDESNEAKQPRLMMVFKPLRKLATMKLAAGPVTTYLHANMRSYPTPSTPGTLEVRIPLGAGQFADIVPRVLRPSAERRAQTDATGNEGYRLDFLELRMGAIRQRFSARWSGCSIATLRGPLNYLWWAGDLDGDGNLDFILSRDGSNDLVLYLSSQAKDGELVGESASFSYSNPAQGKC